MSIRELYEWYEYYKEEPFLADRLEIQIASISSMIGSYASGGKSKLKHSDYMIRKIEKKELDPKELENRIKAMFTPFIKKS